MDTNSYLTIWEFLNTRASTSIAGFFVIVISVVAIYSQRKTTKQKAAIEYLRLLSTDNRLIDASAVIKKIHNNPKKSIETIATSTDDESQKVKKEIVFLLNYFESLAIGIKVGIYDFKTVKLSRNKQIIHTFEYSKPYVYNIRKELNNQKLFLNLEKLVKKLRETD